MSSSLVVALVLLFATISGFAGEDLSRDSLSCGADWVGVNASQQPLRRFAQRLG